MQDPAPAASHDRSGRGETPEQRARIKNAAALYRAAQLVANHAPPEGQEIAQRLRFMAMNMMAVARGEQ